MEALACGTPVVTFRTGGSAEIMDETCGIAVACDDFEALVHAIEYVCKDKPFSSAQCRCRGQQFDEKKRTAGILNIYAEL